MNFENESCALYIGNGLYAVDIGNGKTLVLKNQNENTDGGQKSSAVNKKFGYIKNKNSSFAKWVGNVSSSDLIDEKELIQRFISSGKSSVLSYKLNGETHLLLMLSGSFYHYIVGENDIFISREKTIKRYEVKITDRLNNANSYCFYMNDISEICRKKKAEH